MNSILKNITFAVGSNLVNLLASALIAFVVPKFLGIKQYALWQLYSFYISYKGLMHFGWLDGIYLKYGGKKYQETNKSILHEQFVLLVLLEIILASTIAIASLILCQDYEKRFIFIALGISCMIYLPSTYFQFVLQATNRITDYAKSVFCERIIYAVLVCLFLMSGSRNYRAMIFADIATATTTLAFLCYICRDIVTADSVNYRLAIHEAYECINIGVKLLLGGIGGNLITGMTRQYIESNWGLETFGKVSLALSVSNMLMVFINAISLALYPVVRVINESKVKEIFVSLLAILRAMIYLALLLYYPFAKILLHWLPQYADSFHYMSLLFPLCLFDGIYYLIVMTYLKAIREEKIVLRINWISVAIEAIMLLTVKENIILAITSITITLCIRCCLGVLYLGKYYNIRMVKGLLGDIMMSLLFILTAWNGWLWGLGAYVVIYAFFLYSNFGQYKMIIKKIL